MSRSPQPRPSAAARRPSGTICPHETHPDHRRERIHRRPPGPATGRGRPSGPMPGAGPEEALRAGLGGWRGSRGRRRPGPRFTRPGGGRLRRGVLPGPLDGRRRAGVRRARPPGGAELRRGGRRGRARADRLPGRPGPSPRGPLGSPQQPARGRGRAPCSPRANSRSTSCSATGWKSAWCAAQGEMPKQAPFAVVVGCSDARVPTEMIFGQGFNDLFVIRVAGNVLGDECLGSIDFALNALSDSVKVVVMLGHSGCGAVTGAVDAYLQPFKFWSKSTLVDARSHFAADLRAGPRSGQRPGHGLGARRPQHARLSRRADRNRRLRERRSGGLRLAPGSRTGRQVGDRSALRRLQPVQPSRSRAGRPAPIVDNRAAWPTRPSNPRDFSTLAVSGSAKCCVSITALPNTRGTALPSRPSELPKRPTKAKTGTRFRD